MHNDNENEEELPFEPTEKPPQSECEHLLKEQLKRKKAARQQQTEFAVESYEHPVYGRSLRPCLKTS
jgi:hypothetical protein